MQESETIFLKRKQAALDPGALGAQRLISDGGRVSAWRVEVSEA
ncbi:hypothetical protein ACIKT0_04760 [Hansschlegelia beijingensis]